MTDLRQDMGDTEAEKRVTGSTGTRWGAMAYEVTCDDETRLGSEGSCW